MSVCVFLGLSPTGDLFEKIPSKYNILFRLELNYVGN